VLISVGGELGQLLHAFLGKGVAQDKPQEQTHDSTELRKYLKQASCHKYKASKHTNTLTTIQKSSCTYPQGGGYFAGDGARFLAAAALLVRALAQDVACSGRKDVMCMRITGRSKTADIKVKIFEVYTTLCATTSTHTLTIHLHKNLVC